MLKDILYGNSYESWLISLAILAGSYILIKLIVLFNERILIKITEKTKTKFDDIVVSLIKGPLTLGTMLVAFWFASKRLILPEEVFNAIHQGYSVLIVLNVTWFFSRLSKNLIDEYLRPLADDEEKKHIDTQLVVIISKTSTFLIWTFGALGALHSVGVNVATVFAGLGIGGLAFALAAQDTLKNIFGGLTLFTDRPFKIGDRVKVEGIDGFVQDIGVRSTKLQTLDQRIVTIPNCKIVDAAIENISNEPSRKVILKLGLIYSTPFEKMEEAVKILENIPFKIKDVRKTDHKVTFIEYADSALVIQMIYYIRKGSDIFDTQSTVNFHVLKEFTKADLSFAFPTRTLHVINENAEASK